MDQDDNPMNGCEAKVSEKKCKFGKCREWGRLEPGDQCGTWDGLYCADDGCCQCKKGKTNDMGFCDDAGSENREDEVCDCKLECDELGTNCDIKRGFSPLFRKLMNFATIIMRNLFLFASENPMLVSK